jgi:hypothetical protein
MTPPPTEDTAEHQGHENEYDEEHGTTGQESASHQRRKAEEIYAADRCVVKRIVEDHMQEDQRVDDAKDPESSFW